MIIKANELKWFQISNKFLRFQQITKQGKLNVQRKANGKTRL